MVSLTFCESSLPAEDTMPKKTLEEIHTYAELKHDPRASLPDSFTVCSTVMITGCQSNMWPTFFNILDDNRNHFLAPVLRVGEIKSGLRIGFRQHNTEAQTGKVPPMFPNQWTKSCLAVNTTSGLIQWVVEGIQLLAKNFEEMKNPENQTRNLGKRLVLGAQLYGESWFATTQKVTNLEIYSTPLSTEKMKSKTKGGSCAEEGDYLAWGDMEWILHGQARKETIEKEETCEETPLVDLYYTKFPGMESCMKHCEHLGTRVPSVTTFEEWTELQTYLKKNLYDKGLNTLDIWLPISDTEAEGAWKDFYTGDILTQVILLLHR